jgi:hypothetical protein
LEQVVERDGHVRLLRETADGLRARIRAHSGAVAAVDVTHAGKLVDAILIARRIAVLPAGDVVP